MGNTLGDGLGGFGDVSTSASFAYTGNWLLPELHCGPCFHYQQGSSILFKLFHTVPVEQTPLHLTGLANSINSATFDQIKVQV